MVFAPCAVGAVIGDSGSGNFGDAAWDGVGLIPFGGILGKLAKAGEEAGIGFKSFNAFKRAMGVAGEGQAWHHIVEQTTSNVERFGAEAIHNTNNLIKLPNGAGSIHARISGYYSSIRPFTEGKTVRQWLSTKSFQEQYEFGVKTLKDLGW
jgi:hypothetical protein